MLETGKNYKADVQIKSPMGWIKVDTQVDVQSETTFQGTAKLLGFTVPMTDCTRTEDRVAFVVSPKLPFGVLRVEIAADIAEDGSVTGIANAPRHKPMEIKGFLAWSDSF